MLTRISRGVGVDPHERPNATGKPRLLEELPEHGGLDRLPDLDEPTGERPAASERRMTATHEEDPAATQAHGIDREGRTGAAPRHGNGSTAGGITARAAAPGNH
jgi:hypothetical protein